MKVEQLYAGLKKSQETKGIYFNSDEELVFKLLNSLMQNKNRYGYMACPCRLASGEQEKDKDIICPCVYRAPDLEEFVACYCGLYISTILHHDKTAPPYVPERRSPEKMF